MVEQQQTLGPEQHTEPDPVHELEEVNVSSAYGKKLKLDDSTSTSDVNDCNAIVNIELLKNVFENYSSGRRDVTNYPVKSTILNWGKTN